MARSSMLRTPALWHGLSASPEFIDECRAVVPGCCFGHVEGRDNPVLWVSVDHILNDGIVRLRLVAEARRDVSQNISHIVAALPVVVVAKSPANENRPDSILQSQPVGKLAMNQCVRRQQAAQ